MLLKDAFTEEQLMSINIKVEPGEKKAINIGAVLKPQDLPGIETLHFGYEIHLSDGPSYQMAKSYPIVPIITK